MQNPSSQRTTNKFVHKTSDTIIVIPTAPVPIRAINSQTPFLREPAVLGLIGVLIVQIILVAITAFQNKRQNKQRAEDLAAQRANLDRQLEHQNKSLEKQLENQYALTERQVIGSIRSQARLTWISQVRNAVASILTHARKLDEGLAYIAFFNNPAMPEPKNLQSIKDAMTPASLEINTATQQLRLLLDIKKTDQGQLNEKVGQLRDALEYRYDTSRKIIAPDRNRIAAFMNQVEELASTVLDNAWQKARDGT